MSTEQAALTKGTRVEITDPDHEWYGFKGEVLDTELGVLVTFERWESSIVTPDQLKVIEQPEPTVGQLVDAMHQEIERVCERMDLLEPEIRIDIFPGKKSFVAVRFYEGEELLDNPGCTLEPEPEAALKAMIKRLEQMRKAEK